MSAVSNTIPDIKSVNAGLQWFQDMLFRGLKGGPVRVTLDRDEAPRSTIQNSKGWAMWRDISQQVEWYGERLEDWEWKILLTAIIKKQQARPGIEGGFVVMAYPSSKLTKNEFSQLIELSYAFGSEHTVKWSEPALEAYEQYRTQV